MPEIPAKLVENGPQLAVEWNRMVQWFLSMSKDFFTSDGSINFEVTTNGLKMVATPFPIVAVMLLEDSWRPEGAGYTVGRPRGEANGETNFEKFEPVPVQIMGYGTQLSPANREYPEYEPVKDDEMYAFHTFNPNFYFQGDLALAVRIGPFWELLFGGWHTISGVLVEELEPCGTVPFDTWDPLPRDPTTDIPISIDTPRRQFVTDSTPLIAEGSALAEGTPMMATIRNDRWILSNANCGPVDPCYTREP